MELKEFISSSLTQIMEAVQEAQVNWEQSSGKGAINPAWDGTQRLRDHTQLVEFDVAVTTEQTKSGKGQAGIKIFSASIGADGEMASGHSSVSRIKFALPIVAPVVIIHGGDVRPQAQISDF